LRKKPKDLALLAWKLNLELGLGALDRAETTAKDLTAVVEPKKAESRPGWDALLNLPGAYHEAGRTADARRWCDALRERLTRAGADDPDLLNAWNGLGVVYWRMKQFDQSIPIFERIRAARRKALGERHPATLQAQINLGVNYRDAGRLKEAIPLLEQAEREGRGQPPLRWVRGELLSAYVAARKTSEGMKLVKELLAEARKETAPGSTELAGALAQGGLTLLQLEAFNEAEPVLREALRIREKALPDAWNTFNARSMLGEALAGQKKYADAEPLLVQGFEGMKKRSAQIPAPFRALRLTEAVDRLVRLSEAQGKKEEAAKWRKEREALGKP
jgi:tetratricopeptide (TPR) repeat protein